MAHYTRHDLEGAAGLKAGANEAEGIPDHANVVIVGAGMSGLYVAWRLLELDKPEEERTQHRKVVVLEKINRTGGRLDSDVVHFPDHDDVKEEEGGMRFTFDLMDDLMALFAMLDISDQIVPFPMNSGGNNRLFFRGHAFTNAEAKEGNYAIWSELYDLEQSEQGVNPSSMINTIFNRILAANPQFKDRPSDRTPKFWQDFRLECRWNGVALKDWTLWGLLDAMGYSNEAITMQYRVLGFNGTFLSKMNAGEAFQLLADFPSDPGFKTLSNGFSTLPNALVDAIGKQRIHLGTEVDKVHNHDDGYKLTYTRDDNRGHITADHVVLALPRLALEKLYVGSDLANQLHKSHAHKLWNNLQTTTDQPLLKINLYYYNGWWGNQLSGMPPVSFGPNFSDLPLGSVYPFYSIDPGLSAAADYQAWLVSHDQVASPTGAANLAKYANEKYDKPAALTIYCDYLNINFWQALQDMPDKFTSPMQEKYTNPPDGKPQTIYAASNAVVATATELFEQLFNTHYVPTPAMTSARIWSGTDVFDAPPEQQVGFGVHQWGLHADDKQVIKDMVQPLPNLYTCGEAFSDYQGWVEGALRSADLVLACFGMDPISKVFADRHDGTTASEAVSASYDKTSTERIREYIDPDFEPHSCARVDLTRTAPTAHETYGAKLTYFDERVPAHDD